MSNSAYENPHSSENNKLLVLLGIVFIFLLVIVSLLALRKNSSPQDSSSYPSNYSQSTNPNIDPNAAPYRLKFDNPNTQLKVGSRYKVNLNLEAADNELTGVGLKINFDPKLLKIESLSLGDVWGGKANELCNSLKPGTKCQANSGEVKYQVGQGFDSPKSSAGVNLAVIEFTVLDASSSQAVLAISTDSVAVKQSQTGAIGVFAEPLILSLNQ